jgi:predicted PurR-regulated permease PerM
MHPNRSEELRLFVYKLWLIVFFILIAGVVYWLRTLMLLTFLSILVAILWGVIADGLQKLSGGKLHRYLAVGLAILFFFGLFFLLGYFLYEPLNEQFVSFTENLPKLMRDLWMRLQPFLRRVGLDELDPSAIDVGAMTGGVVRSTMTVLGASVSTLSGLIAVFFLAFFWAIDPERYLRGTYNLLPPARREWAHQITARISYTLRQWMKATGMSMLTISVLTTTLLSIVGLPYALLFGIAAGLFDIIPFLGPILAFIGPTLVAFSISPTMAFWIIIGYMIIQMVEGNIVVPYFMSREAELPPALTIFVIFAMGELFGFLGIFVAAPTLALIVATVRAVYSIRRGEEGA